MKLSDVNMLLRLANDRRRVVCLLDELRHGAEIEASVCGWEVPLDDQVMETLSEAAIRDVSARLDAVEQEMKALGIQIDVPRAEYLTYNENVHECDCQSCASARAELGLDESEEVAA